MINLNRLKAWYRLLDQKSIGNKIAHRLIDDLGDPLYYIGVQNDLWDKIDYVPDDIKLSLQTDIDPPNWKKIVPFVERSPYFKFFCILDEEYPDNLKEVYLPPLFFTAIGDEALLKSDEIVSIVGTRKPTHYGKMMTERIVASLINFNFIICSGLAFGIDSVSHKKTLDLNGKTIAVTANGLDSVYPPQNRELANNIAKTGLIISETMPFTKLEKYHFPQRNRIIAGLAKAVCVIEGKIHSGAMITGNFAADQGKEVYALPGDITKPEAEGPNNLIKRGANIIITPDSIIQDLIVEYKAAPKKAQIILTDEESKIYEIIKNYSQGIHIDQIIAETGQNLGEISAILFMLELKNAIKATDNGKYQVTYL